jgi:hypothetical protein
MILNQLGGHARAQSSGNLSRLLRHRVAQVKHVYAGSVGVCTTSPGTRVNSSVL